MLPWNLLHLDWHTNKEYDSPSRLFDGERSYLDHLFETVGLGVETTASG